MQKHWQITQNFISVLILTSTIGATQALCATEHSADFSARLRLNQVDQHPDQSTAGSALLRVSIDSQWHDQLNTLLQIDQTASIISGHQGDTGRNRDNPGIPGRPGTDLNQLFIRYHRDQFHITLGRQRIEYDNQRFVGSDNYWQREQTFDSASTEFTVLTGSRINYAYIANVKRIYGDVTHSIEHPDYNPVWLDEPPSALQADHRHDTHLARMEWNEWDYMQLVLYGYLINNRDMPEWSNNTLGLRYRLSRRINQLRYRLELEVARQQLTEISGKSQPEYYLADTAIGYRAAEFFVRHERLEADNNHGFKTPLGSAYRFQGLAGMFRHTPEAGIINNTLGLAWRSHPWRIDVGWHNFHSHANSYRYGRELDVDIHYQLTRQHQFLLRYARFQASASYLQNRDYLALDYSYNF